MNFVLTMLWTSSCLRNFKNCVICKREQFRTFTGTPSRKFTLFLLSQNYASENTRLDYAGRIYVKLIFKYHANNSYKIDICLFTYATRRSIFLDLTPTMDGKSRPFTLIRCIMQFGFQRGDVKLFFSHNSKAFKCGNMEEYLTLKILAGNLSFLLVGKLL